MTAARTRCLSAPSIRRIQRTLESGLRKWVGEQTNFDLGYTEQLYTFGDSGRHLPRAPTMRRTRVVSVGYLALTRQAGTKPRRRPTREWRGWYHYFPWEDWRDAKPAMIDSTILPRLQEIRERRRPMPQAAELRRERMRLCFGDGGVAWDEEKVLERYELLYEAGLVRGSRRDSGKAISRDRPRCWAAPCCSTIAASWPPRSPGCAAR